MRLNAILGRLLPARRTLAQWGEEYLRILATRNLAAKSLANRRNSVRRALAALGHRPVRAVRPVEIAVAVRAIWDSGQATTARLVLQEIRDMLNEAMLASWVETNAAEAVKALPVRVRRQRLSIEQWELIYGHSLARGIPWLPSMLLLALVTGQRRADLQKMRFDDVWDGHLHVVQQKRGARIAIPVALRLDAAGVSLADVIDGCRRYGRAGETMLRKSDGAPLGCASLTVRFEELRDTALGSWESPGDPPTLHECRSLAERLYRAQGIDTRTLLGHRRQSMTDKYNDDRGLTAGEWKRLVL